MKVFGTLCGVSFLSLVMLLFFWLEWEEEAKAHSQQLKVELERIERYWNQRSAVQQGSLSIGYAEMVESGFPFDTRIRLLKPYVRDERGSQHFIVTGSFLDFVVLPEGESHFQLEYPDEGFAYIERGSSRQSYYLHLTNPPPLYIRKRPVGGVKPSLINEYGFIFPPSALFTADYNGKTMRFPLRFNATQSPLWKPMLPDMRERLGQLRGLLRRGMMGL